MSSGIASLRAAFCCRLRTRKMLLWRTVAACRASYRNSCLLTGRDQLIQRHFAAAQTVRMDMFDGLVRFLTGVGDCRQSSVQNDAAFALAILLIEVARSDDRVDLASRA
jgi:hypothetical protein